MNIGLVLSGGMAKGAYQIGALKALGNFIPQTEIKYISAASIGVLNGYAYATGNISCAESMWKNICTDDSRFIISQVLKSSLFQKNIEKLYSPQSYLSANFYCSLLNFSKKTVVYKNLLSVDNHQIPLYLKASVAMPIYNKAVKIEDISYFDGAMVDNIPVFPLLKHELDYIICIYFDNTYYKFEETYLDNKVIKISFPAESVLKQSLILRKDSIEKMLKDGYDRAAYILNSIFSKGYDNLECIYDSIVIMNSMCKNQSLRITGDVCVTNLNKLTQKFAKRKIF